MSYTSSDPENLHRVPEASTSGQAPKTKKKPWSKFKSSIKSIGEKMSAKPKFTESTESSEQKRARKNKKFKSGEEGVGEELPSKTSSKGLMKKLSVESLATPFVGMQPSTINPAKSYAKAVNSTGSTSESNLSTSDPDTPKKTPTPDSGRASQATDGEEAAIGSLVAKTEQFAQSLLPPQAANEKLKDVSAEFVKTEGRSPGQRKKPNEVEEDGRAKGSVETKRELKADTKQDLSKGAVDDVEGRRKKMGASVDLIKAESGVEPKAEEKIAPTRKQKSEEKMVRDKEALEGKTDKNDEQLKPDAKNNQSNRQNPTKGIDKSIKEEKTGKPDEKSATLAKEASKITPIPDSAEVKQPTKDTTKDKEPKENKEGSKTVQKASDTEKQKTTVDKKGRAFKDVTEGSKIMQNVSDKENKQPTKDVKKEDPYKEKKEESKTTPTSEKAQPIKDIKKVDLSEENREESKTTPTSEKAQSTKDVKKGVAPKEKKEDSKTMAKASDKENKLGGKDMQQEGANSSIDPTDRLMSTERRPSPSQGGLTVEEKLEAFLSAESWPSSLREEVAQSSSGKTSQQGDGDKRECLYKILVIGELGTGKTSIIKRYVHQFFSQHYRATIGVDFALKVLNWDPNTIIRLQLWDIAGQERFGNMTRVYYKEAVGAFIVFDVTRSATFDAVLKWKQDLDSKVQLADGGPIPCVLLANKCDQQKEGLVNTPSKMDDYCKENNFSAWFETSAKENINIDDAAKSLVTQILQNDKMSQNGRDSARDGSKFPLDGKQEEEGGGGCAC